MVFYLRSIGPHKYVHVHMKPKKILEVVRTEDGKIKFDTDYNVHKDPLFSLELIPEIEFWMSTDLWGGNEMSVLAVLRALTIADLALCKNRKKMIHDLDLASENSAKIFNMAMKEMENRPVKN